jgi:Lar family restriction alleviation protein
MMELKACPYCGENLTGKGTTSSGRMYISCINCESEGPVGDDEQEMIEAWNTRVDPWISVETLPDMPDNNMPEWSDRQLIIRFSGMGYRAIWIHDLHWLMQSHDPNKPTHWMEIPITPPEVT